MRLKEIALGRSDVFRVAPDEIHIREGWNARDFNDPANAAHVEMLAESIAEIGVKKPLTVFIDDGKIWLTDGESRLRAIRLAISRGAEIKSVPVLPEERWSNEGDRLLTQIVGNSGKPFGSLEKAEVFHRLIGLGWSESDIAKKCGVSRVHVTDMLKLRAAPKEITDHVKAGDISPTLALQTIKRDKTGATETVRKAVASARESGKDRATAKHVSAPTKRQRIASIISDAQPGKIVPGGICVYFAPEDWQFLKELV